MFADELGEDKLELPRAGPEGGSCQEISYGNRQNPQWVRIFKQSDSIVGLGIVFSEDDFLKLGLPSLDATRILVDDGHHLVGFYGATSEESMTQIGLIVEDITCSIEYRENQLSNDDDSSNIGAIFLWIAIVFVALIVLGMTGVGCFFGIRKLKNRR